MNLKERFFSTDSREVPDEIGDGNKAKGVIFLDTREEEIIELLKEANKELSNLKRRVVEVEKSTSSARRWTKDRLKKLEGELTKRHSRTFNSLQEVRSATEHFQAELRELNKRGEDRDKLVESLQERARRLQKEFLFDNLIGDGARKLIGLRDAVGEQKVRCEGDRREFLSHLEDRLLEALEELEVREVSVDGEGFDPQFQEIVEKVPVESPEKADSVLEVVEPGYRWEDTVLRPQRVIVGELSRGGEIHGR